MYNPQIYWEERLSRNFNLKGVGHQSFGSFYNYWLYKRKKAVLSKLLGEEPLLHKSVLDVGCGTGFFVDWYVKRGAKVSGIDISRTAVSRLRNKYPGLSFEKIDFSSDNYQPAQKYDIINVWDVIYHQVDDEAFFNLIENVDKALMPNGLFIGTDVFSCPASFSTAPHVKFRSLEAYEDQLSPKGYKVKVIYPLYHLLNRPLFYSMIPKYVYDIVAVFLFLADNFQTRQSLANLSVCLWEKG